MLTHRNAPAPVTPQGKPRVALDSIPEASRYHDQSRIRIVDRRRVGTGVRRQESELRLKKYVVKAGMCPCDQQDHASAEHRHHRELEPSRKNLLRPVSDCERTVAKCDRRPWRAIFARVQGAFAFNLNRSDPWPSEAASGKDSSKKEFFFSGTNLPISLKTKGRGRLVRKTNLPFAAKYSDGRPTLLYPGSAQAASSDLQKQGHEVGAEEPS